MERAACECAQSWPFLPWDGWFPSLAGDARNRCCRSVVGQWQGSPAVLAPGTGVSRDPDQDELRIRRGKGLSGPARPRASSHSVRVRSRSAITQARFDHCAGSSVHDPKRAVSALDDETTTRGEPGNGVRTELAVTRGRRSSRSRRPGVRRSRHLPCCDDPTVGREAHGVDRIRMLSPGFRSPPRWPG